MVCGTPPIAIEFRIENAANGGEQIGWNATVDGDGVCSIGGSLADGMPVGGWPGFTNGGLYTVVFAVVSFGPEPPLAEQVEIEISNWSLSVCSPSDVAASTISTTDPTRICIDGVGDPIDVTVDTDGGGTPAWVITDAAGTILALPPGPPFDLEGAGAGTCLIWLANVDDPSFMPQVSDDAAAIAAATCAVLSNPIAVERLVDCGSTDPTISLSDPCNCANGVDLNNDGVIDFASETVTIAPGAIPYTVTDYSGGLVDMIGAALTLMDIQDLINAAVPDADGNISFDAYLPTDDTTVFSISISDASGATAEFTKPTGCPSCTDPENVPTVGEWGLIILGLLMSITAVVGIRARRREESYS